MLGIAPQTDRSSCDDKLGLPFLRHSPRERGELPRVGVGDVALCRFANEPPSFSHRCVTV